MTTSVLQNWLELCTWKEQTVLLCALRGTDAAGTPELKAWVRWLRSIILKNAAPNKTFMKPELLTHFEVIAAYTPLCLDMLPVHYLTHLMHALQVIANRHPLLDISKRAYRAYHDLVNYLHLKPESSEEMFIRLKDEI